MLRTQTGSTGGGCTEESRSTTHRGLEQGAALPAPSPSAGQRLEEEEENLESHSEGTQAVLELIQVILGCPSGHV